HSKIRTKIRHGGGIQMIRPIAWIVCLLSLLSAGGLLGYWVDIRPGNGQLTINVYARPTLMTIAAKVYANPHAGDGQYWLSKTVLHNTGQSPLKNVRISYQIPDFIPWITPDQPIELLPGQTAVIPFYPRLPAKVTSIRSRTPATLQIKVEYTDNNGDQVRTDSEDFYLRGITEMEYTSLPADEIASWYDMFDNRELLAAYVCDEDPVVKAYYARISRASKGFAPIEDSASLQQFARSVYDFMVSTGMSYSGDKGIPEKLGDVSTITQSIRLPRDVIADNSGLCIELALLWCSVGEVAGAKPYLILIPGHAFVVLSDDNGDQLPIECTAIGGGGKGGNLAPPQSFDQAVAEGTMEFSSLSNAVAAFFPFAKIDIEQEQQDGIQAPELPDVDLAALNQMLDAKPRSGRMVATLPLTDWSFPGGGLTLGYPSDWKIDRNQLQAIQSKLPGYKLYARDPATHFSVEVMSFDNISDAEAAFRQYTKALGDAGIDFTGGPHQHSPRKINHKPADKFNIRFPATEILPERNESIYVVKVKNRFFAFGFCCPTDQERSANAIFQEIMNAVRFNR
ncbi:MAG TPA: hypothetical protein VMD30_05635, partial [Tepidisphaeraceae bacterium]|nr:hypothetical protein [Tepidisphaeraceae bacterium]